jgi:hypothetical protein
MPNPNRSPARRSTTAILTCLACGLCLTSIAVAQDANEGGGDKAAQSRIRLALAEIGKALSKGDDGRPLDEDDEKYPAFHRRAWELFGQWAAAFLDEHPDASSAELAAAFAGLRLPAPDDGADFDVEALRLAAGEGAAYVLVVRWGWPSTFFVVGREAAGRFGVLWRVYDVAVEHLAKRDELGRWAFLSPGFHDGPLAGTPHLLPPTADGHPRFMIDGLTMPRIGGNRSAQIGIWEWDGAGAIPVFQRTYETHWVTHSVEWLGDRIVYRSNMALRSFWVCGSCVGPQNACALRLSAAGVEDEGCQAAEPELAFFDELFQRVLQGLDARSIASDAVIRALTQLIEECRRQTTESSSDQPPASFSLGQLGAHRVVSGASGVALHLSGDEMSDLTLQIERRNGAPFASAVIITPW